MTEEMQRMQREAEERVRQMHAKAQQYTAPPLTIHESSESHVNDKSIAPVEDKLSQDRFLVFLLAVLLMKNNAQIELIIALLYLVM